MSDQVARRIADKFHGDDPDTPLDLAVERIEELEAALREIRDDRWISGRGVSQGSHYDHVRDIARRALDGEG